MYVSKEALRRLFNFLRKPDVLPEDWELLVADCASLQELCDEVSARLVRLAMEVE